MITEEDYKNWWASPVGMEVAAMLKERQNRIAHGLGNGAARGDVSTYDETVGRYKEIQDLKEMTFKELMGDV